VRNLKGVITENEGTYSCGGCARSRHRIGARAESGIASHYSTRELGTRTASGRPLHDGALTAAHRTLPFGSRVRVTNHANGRSVVVTITDRGPFARGRVIDITTAGARALGFSGLAHVSLVRIGKDS
jgi:rare lipoprotein A